MSDLSKKIEDKKAIVGVVGLGYVGLPLLIMTAKKGFRGIGFDIKEERVKMVNSGKSYIEDAKEEELEELVKKKKIRATSDFDEIKECDIVLICVPTPLDKNKVPDLRYVIATSNEIKKRLRKGQLIILKSTSFPETTEKVLLPLLSESGLKVGQDFYLAFAPERIDPGNRRFTVENIPVVVGGVTPECTRLACKFYDKCGIKTFAVSSPRVAEMTKLLENVFRNVNIALVNEMALLCERMGIDIWEVIEAAGTKPFGFMKFYPGPGVGGHCIPIDPYYLLWKAQEYDFHTSFIELSARINDSMPYHVVQLVMDALSENGICPRDAKVLVLGVAFKRDVKDKRDSPALKVIQLLKEKVKKVYYNDPYITDLENENYVVLTEENLRNVDCVVITTDHSLYDYKWIVENSKIIVDTRNATKGINAEKIYKLGCGKI